MDCVMYTPRHEPTTIYGLKWRPTLEGVQFSNLTARPDDMDTIVSMDSAHWCGWSECCKTVLRETIQAFGDSLRCVVEIGVDRDDTHDSLTSVLLDTKSAATCYVGVDINDKSSLDDSSRNIYTIRTDSSDHARVLTLLRSLGHDTIDLLFIDGWHSINQVVRDWQYVQWLSPQGVVLLHDVAGHPGPSCVYDAIDETQFHKQVLCTTEDFGIGRVWRVGSSHTPLSEPTCSVTHRTKPTYLTAAEARNIRTERGWPNFQ